MGDARSLGFADGKAAVAFARAFLDQAFCLLICRSADQLK
jgi:hypothetical protein